jgi:hypothetical protein
LLHSTCIPFSGDTPVADGPRHCGQFSARRIGAKSTRIAVENRIVVTASLLVYDTASIAPVCAYGIHVYHSGIHYRRSGR